MEFIILISVLALIYGAIIVYYVFQDIDAMQEELKKINKELKQF